MKVIIFLLTIFLISCPGQPPHLTEQSPQNTQVEQVEQSAQSAQAEEPALTLIECIAAALEDFYSVIPQGTIIGLIGISSPDEFEADFVQEQLLFNLVQSRRYRVVERRDLENIFREQNFQYSGYVDDDTMVSIGRMAGAEVVISGSIGPFASLRYLNLRVLDVESGIILAASSRSFIPVF